jgi:glyoxylase-like metal-dependent hydrolase (beta-lactamase superfamily II)
LAIATHPQALVLPLPGGSPGATVRVWPLRCGEVLMPPRALERPRGPLWQLRGIGLTAPRSRWFWVPVPVFLVEHPTAGRMLVDTGFHATVRDDPRTSLGRRHAWLLPARLGREESAPARLRALGVEPAEIGLIVMTHLHNDHASGATQFAHATFVVDEVEWRAASAGGFLQGYRREHYDQPFDWRTIDYAGPAAHAHGAFQRTVDLFGDGSVRLLSTPGHTLGHQSLLLALDGRELLLTADAAYTRRTIDEDLVPIFFEDERLYLRSLAQLREHVRANPRAPVICGHDAQRWPRLDPIYA